MIRAFALSISLIAAATPALARHHGGSATGAGVAMPADSNAFCSAIQSALHPNGQAPDSATVAALHTLMSVHHAGGQADSATISAMHTLHAHLAGAVGDSTAHTNLMATMHNAVGGSTMSDSAAHAAIHNAMMTCMHQH